MRKYFFFIIFYIITFANILPQLSGWFWQNPLPQGNDLVSIEMLSSSIGWAVGRNGTIVHTKNSGESWVEHVSGTNSDLQSVYFTDISNGIAVGNYGTILITIMEHSNK
jgi:photosystem II stability/assembly factor-like uncharacterized protein